MKLDLQEVGWVGGWGWGMDWIDVIQNWGRWRASTCKGSNEPTGSIKSGEFLE